MARHAQPVVTGAPVNHNLRRLEVGVTISIDSDEPLPEHTLQQNLQERFVEPVYIASDHASNAIPSVVRKIAFWRVPMDSFVNLMRWVAAMVGSVGGRCSGAC